MYETRWPRPGPALLVVGTIFGLIVGGILGISFPASSSDQPPATTTDAPPPRTTASLPTSFYTVVLASPLSSQEAQARAAQFQAQGIKGARVLTRAQFPSLGAPFAVCVGTHDTYDAANQAAKALRTQFPSVSPYVRSMRRAT